MAVGGGPADRSVVRSEKGTDRRTSRLWTDRSATLAVSLTVVLVLSLFAVPVGGAPPEDPGSSTAGGSPGGEANGGSDGDSGGDDESDADGDGGSNAAGGSGDSDGGASSDSGPAGPTNAGGNGAGSPEHSTADGNGAGPPEHSNAGENGEGNGTNGAEPGEAGPPDHSNPGGDDSGGPSVTVSSEDDDRSPGRSSDAPPSSVVEVSVKGAEAGDDVDLDVSPSAVEDDAVAFEGISLTVKRDGDFTMRVTNSREPLPGSPAFDPEEAAESLGRIRLDHSITNEEVEEVSYTFRVSKAHLRATDTDFEDVSLYRHADGRWNELPTDVVGETETHYVFSADSPGMSEFAIGAKRPSFDAYWADVEAGSVEAGDVVSVSGRVTNHGGADGVYDARLLVDGEVVEQRSVTIAAGGTRQVNFRTRMDRPGERAVAINERTAGEVTVTARQAESGSGSVDGGLSVVFDRLLDVGQTIGVLPAPGGG